MQLSLSVAAGSFPSNKQSQTQLPTDPQRNKAEEAVTRGPSLQCRQKEFYHSRFVCLLHCVTRSAMKADIEILVRQAGSGFRAYRVWHAPKIRRFEGFIFLTKLRACMLAEIHKLQSEILHPVPGSRRSHFHLYSLVVPLAPELVQIVLGRIVPARSLNPRSTDQKLHSNANGIPLQALLQSVLLAPSPFPAPRKPRLIQKSSRTARLLASG